jgi:hypothetical protein
LKSHAWVNHSLANQQKAQPRRSQPRYFEGMPTVPSVYKSPSEFSSR